MTDRRAGLPDEPLLEEWAGEKRLYRLTPISWQNFEIVWATGGVILILLASLTTLADLPLRRSLRRQILRYLWGAVGTVIVLAAAVGIAVPFDGGEGSASTSLLLGVILSSRALGGLLLVLYRRRLQLAYRAYEFWGPARGSSLVFPLAPLIAGFVLDLLVLMPVNIAAEALRGAFL